LFCPSGTQNVNNNRIVLPLLNPGAGGTVTLLLAAAVSIAGAVINPSLAMNFSNITITGATVLTGWSITGYR
jgi:hypothetical protein